MGKNKMINNLKKILASLVVASLPLSQVKAEEPIKVGITDVVQREKPLLAQAFVDYNKNKALFEQQEKSQNYGLIYLH